MSSNDRVNQIVCMILDALSVKYTDNKQELLDTIVDNLLENDMGPELIVALEKALIVESILLNNTESALEIAENVILKDSMEGGERYGKSCSLKRK